MGRHRRDRSKSSDKKIVRGQPSNLSDRSLNSGQLHGAIPGRFVVLKPESTFKLRDPLNPLYTVQKSDDTAPRLPPRAGKPLRSYSVNSYDGLLQSGPMGRKYMRRYATYHKRGFMSRWCCEFGSSKRSCVCFVPLIFGLGILGAFALYFGLTGFPTFARHEKVYRGSFKVVDGDVFSDILSDPTSDAFLMKAQQYEMYIEDALSSGSLDTKQIHAEVVSFSSDDLENNNLEVTFNLYTDSKKSIPSIKHLKSALGNAVEHISLPNNRTGKSRFSGLTIDPSTIEIKERNFKSIMEDFPSTLTKRPHSLYHSRFHNAGFSSKNGNHFKKACVPLSAPFCKGLGYNFTSYPNVIRHRSPREVEKVLESATLLVNSRCSSQVRDMLCYMLQPPCDQKMKKAKKLCKKTCLKITEECSAEALNNPSRRTHLPTTELYRINNEVSLAVKELLQCELLPKDGACLDTSAVPVLVRSQNMPADDCARDLVLKKMENLICDGIMDCSDFTDESECGYCPIGFVHCGVGKKCIEARQRCDGVVDCPNGSDERGCLSIAPSMEAASYVHQYFNDGFVIYTEGVNAGKVCLDSFNSTEPSSKSRSFLEIFGESLCKQLSYRYMVSIDAVYDNERSGNSIYAQLSQFGNPPISFSEEPCYSNSVLRLKCAELECGIRPVQIKPPFVNTISRSATISSPEEVAHGDWPWHVALLKEGIHVCDGTLVSDVWILTSQSCFENSPRANWVARLASVRTSSMSPWEQEKLVVGMVRSPLPGSGIVLAKLESSVIFSDFVRPSCLGYEGMRLDRNTRCIVITWDEKGNAMREVKAKLTSPEMCLSSFRTNSSKILSMCAESSENSSSCEDEIFNGAPLLCQESEQGAWSLVGIATSFMSCRQGMRELSLFQGKPYESVALLADWVVRTIRVTRPISN
ncbi:atrial natriuretic peptide-converting enzyme-like [Artemia franciscana]|uniref:Atrial natriuretic peptide-converting enzyme n=1 Tax=Artemia franciscana TaxID=6661 RepID=A0AA88L544_ARTSF|nr:hypothetical protein QYM36_014015 [Artemia franciscana]